MKALTKRLILTGFIVCFALMLSPDRIAAQQQPRAAREPLMSIRLFTGEDGLTHAEHFDVNTMPNVAKAANIRFLRIKAGTIEDYHHAPQKQYVVTLSGHAVIGGIAGGEQIVQAPGVLLMTEDTTGKGHTAQIGAAEDLVIMEIALP